MKKYLILILFFTTVKGSPMIIDIQKVALEDNNEYFEAILIKPTNPLRIVLFAVGSGGNPKLHLPLLESFAKQGAIVIAPIFTKLTTMPTQRDIQIRARLLHASVNSLSNFKLPLIGVGHSIGGTLLVGLAKGQIWFGPGQQVHIPTNHNYEGLVLMAPPTGFFRAPGALDEFNTPIQAWAGKDDQITPPSQIEFLEQRLAGRVSVELQIIEKAGHFTFMDTLPPHVTDSYPDRPKFLSKLRIVIQDFFEKL